MRISKFPLLRIVGDRSMYQIKDSDLLYKFNFNKSGVLPKFVFNKIFPFVSPDNTANYTVSLESLSFIIRVLNNVYIYDSVPLFNEECRNSCKEGIYIIKGVKYLVSSGLVAKATNDPSVWIPLMSCQCDYSISKDKSTIIYSNTYTLFHPSILTCKDPIEVDLKNNYLYKSIEDCQALYNGEFLSDNHIYGCIIDNKNQWFKCKLETPSHKDEVYYSQVKFSPLNAKMTFLNCPEPKGIGSFNSILGDLKKSSLVNE